MRTLLSTIFLCCFTLVGFAQEMPAEDKTLDLAAEVTNSRDRLILELNHTGFINPTTALETKWYSRGANIYFTYDFPIGESERFFFSPGVGLSFHNAYTNSTLVTDSVGSVSNYSFFNPIPDEVDYSTNKFNTNSIEAPLELRYRTRLDNNGRAFKLGVGFRVARILSAKTKYRGEQTIDGITRNVKVKNLLLDNMPKLRYGPSFRIGYGEYSLVAYYALNGIFEENFGPDIHAFSIGISFNSF